MFLKTGIFIVIILIITVLLAVVQQKINLGFEKITLPQLAPALAFLAVSLIFTNIAFSVNIDFNKSIALKTLIAFILPLLLFGISFFAGKQAGLNVKLTENLQSILPIMLIGIIIGAIGEEIGWRSFLQPFLEKKNSVLIASVLVGCIWGLWHIGHYKNGLLFMVGFLLFTISASIIIAWLLRGTQYNLIIATVFHIAVNLGFVLFFKNSLTDAKLIIINGIIWFIPAIIIVLINGKYFFKLKLSTARKGKTRLKKPNFHNRRRAQRCLRFLSADSEKFCPFGQVQPFRTAAGNATLACGYENQAHSG